MKSPKQPHPLSPFCRASVCRLLPTEPRRILALTTDELQRAGATAAEIKRIIAAQQLAQFADEFRVSETTRNNGPSAAAYTIARILPTLRYLEHEEFWVVPMDSRNQALRPYKCGQGTNRTCPAHPREVFSHAIEQRAESILTVHNHPSGDLTPSEADFNVWNRLAQAADVIGISNVDNFILSRRGVYSQKAPGIVLEF